MKKKMTHLKSLRIIAMLLLCLFCMTANAQEGSWKGELDLGGMKLPLVFNFSADGCTMDSPAQGAKGIKAEKTVDADGTISVTVGAIGAAFKGKMEGEEIRGSFTQGGMSLPLTLKRGKVETRRPQTPQPPFAYKTEEVTFSNAGFTFNGTLTVPEKMTRDTPVVVMVTGSGQQNRDEELFLHKPFAVIADALARHGIATLRYDDRGYGDKSVRFADFTTEDFKKDAEAAMTVVRGRFGKTGVLGHSEGGTIALMMAAEGKADFVVSMAGMVMPGSETLLMQNRDGLKKAGVSDEMTEAYCKALGEAFKNIAEGKTVGTECAAQVPPQLRQMFDKAVKQCETPFFRCFVALDIRTSLKNVRCPVLAINGKRDTQVDCQTNLDALRQGLTGCRPCIKEYDNLNHLFQHCTTGDFREYQQIEETIAPEVLETMAKWINETTKP